MYYNFSFDQYICYEIEEGIVKVTSYNEPGGNRTVSIGSVGSVRNPKVSLLQKHQPMEEYDSISRVC
jgi:hypothetical protein